MLLIVTLVQLVAFIVFTLQFLNIRPPVQKASTYETNNIPDDQQPLVDRLVFIVIDALRADFVFDDKSPMSFTRSLLSDGRAKGYIAKASAPTVTLPRLKALTAGTPPVFLDFIANLDERSGSKSDASGEDSWVKQLFLAGKRMVFLGDDTWLRLFPKHYFIRTDPTTSFYVKDTVIVDRNVTRHIDEEFKKNDWDVIVLHYLGVDHIGHVEGAKGPLMKPKLIEMDAVISKIYNYISSEPHNRTVMFVLGDHGMTDTGNHGGSSPEEVNTAFIAISHPPLKEKTSKGIEVINQLDIAPTISSLFGVSIPKFGIGKIIRQLVEGRVSEARLCRLLLDNLRVLSNQDGSIQVDKFADCGNCHENCSKCIKEIQLELESSRERLSSQYGSYNFPALVICLLVSTAAVIVLWNGQLHRSNLIEPLCIFSYCMSIMASSFIDEEHEIWNHILPLAILASQRVSNLDKLIGLVCARILRNWNSNGYEYRSLPDMKAFLDANKLLRTVLLAVALCFFVYKAYNKQKKPTSGLLMAYASIVVAWKCELVKGPLVERLILSLGPLLSLIDSASLGVLMISVSKTHNAIPLALQSIIQSMVSSGPLIAIHHSYFAMGMSNLITSIDLSNSYIGLHDYRPSWVGLMTFVVLFAGPLQTAWFANSYIDLERIVFWRASVQLAVMFCCFIQRHHISVWTVFTPRLLFEVLWTAFYGLFLVPINVLKSRRK